MCLIIFTTNLQRARVRKSVLEKAFFQNYDGVGIAYLDDGVLKVSKSNNDIFDDFYANYCKIRDFVGTGPCLIHFRAKSVGLVNAANTQPVVINPASLVMAHNGTIDALKGGEDSDSVVLGSNIKKLDWTFPYSKPQIEMLRMLCAGRSKLVFFDSTGKYQIINDKLGKWSRGAWYSDGGDILDYDPVYSNSYKSIKSKNYSVTRYDVDELHDFPGAEDDDLGFAERQPLPRLGHKSLMGNRGGLGARTSVKNHHMSPQQRADIMAAKYKAKRFTDIDPDLIADSEDWCEWQEIRYKLVS